MAERTHISPAQDVRFRILVQLSHVHLGFLVRSYAGITIFREVFTQPSFNLFDPSTWFGRGKWIREGAPRQIVDGAAFFNRAGVDVSSQLDVFTTDRPGHFGRFALFVSWAFFVHPDFLGNDARAVSQVHLEYTLPWESEGRTLAEQI